MRLKITDLSDSQIEELVDKYYEYETKKTAKQRTNKEVLSYFRHMHNKKYHEEQKQKIADGTFDAKEWAKNQQAYDDESRRRKPQFCSVFDMEYNKDYVPADDYAQPKDAAVASPNAPKTASNVKRSPWRVYETNP